MTLRNRLIAAFLASTLVPLAATVWITTSLLDRSLRYATTGELDRLSRQIHGHPELGYQEVKACGWLSEFLSGKGFKVEQGVGGVPTAFLATLETGPGPTIAILCEYDALPGIGPVTASASDGWAG